MGMAHELRETLKPYGCLTQLRTGVYELPSFTMRNQPKAATGRQVSVLFSPTSTGQTFGSAAVAKGFGV